MHTRWKRRLKAAGNFFTMACYGAVGVLWLVRAGRGYMGTPGFTAFLGLVWLAGAGIWCYRAVKTLGK